MTEKLAYAGSACLVMGGLLLAAAGVAADHPDLSLVSGLTALAGFVIYSILDR